MTNRLANAASRYLQQHADNPVDWFSWGEEPFDEAKRRDVPIFLSIGYSTCHWCHVMAQESFADQRTATLLNERFVAIKVDSEERPDVNTAYMQALQTMTGRGGWPMSMFLTPEGTPFLAGSYWPKQARNGLPAFEDILMAASKAWRQRRDEVTARAQQVFSFLSARAQPSPASGPLDISAADEAARLVVDKDWDRHHGGFSSAPKFPHAMTIEWLLHRHARTGGEETLQAALHALHAMARGAIHDQLGGGFSRYTIDRAWSWPHFEQMLYDNALLLPAYATAAALTEDGALYRVARTTADYLITNLQGEHGGFASATDADADGREGAYYTWAYYELIQALDEIGADPRAWTSFLGATPEGNWNGTNVLRQAMSIERMAERLRVTGEDCDREWARVRAHLLKRRAERVAPGKEQRVLADWNALTVRGLVRAGQLLNEPGWLNAAATSAEFLHDQLVVNGRLRHSWRDGQAIVDGFMLDHAALALADLELFQATGEPTWFERAMALATEAHERFRDSNHSGWRQSTAGRERLLSAGHRVTDNAIPAGSSVMVEVCLVLARLTGDDTWQSRAETAIGSQQDRARQSPMDHGWLLRQIEAVAAPPQEIVVIGRPGSARDALTRAAVRRPRPGTVTVIATPQRTPAAALLDERGEIDGRPTAYVCRGFTCQPPVTTAARLAAQLNEATQVAAQPTTARPGQPTRDRTTAKTSQGAQQ